MSTLQTKFTLDDLQERQLATYLKSFPPSSDATFVVFDHEDFYTAHDSNAVFAAKEIFKSTAILKYIGKGEKKVPTVYLSQLNLESLVRDLLLVRHYRIEIYRNKTKTGSKWELSCKASPGNLTQIEDLLFKNNELKATSSGVIAVKQFQSNSGGRNVGIGFIDTITREIQVAEFEDNEVFSNLESTIIQLGARECLLQKLDQTSECTKLAEVVKRSGVLMSERPKKEFQSKDLIQDLGRILKKNKKTGETLNATVAREISEKDAAACALASCINYLELLNNEDNFDQYIFKTYDLSQYMRLDRSAYSALNLFSNESSSYSVGGMKKSADSLYNLLDQCKTQQAKRLLSQWIKQPLLDVNHVKERLNLVEAFVCDTTLRLTIYGEYLRSFPDLCRMSKKFHRKNASLQDCYKVYQGLKSIPMLCECLARNEDQHASLLKEFFTTPLHELSLDFAKFTEMVETTLDFKMIEQHQFRVKADFDPELLELQEKMDRNKLKMDKCFNEAAQDLQLEKGKGIKLESSSQLGYFFRVTCKEEKKLRNKKSYYTIDTNKAGVRFVTDKMSQLSEIYQECQKLYEQQQLAIVNEIVRIAAGYSEPMLLLGDLIAKLDVLISFAQVSVNAPCPFVKPEVYSPDENKGIVLKECRHPCLERQDDVDFIPNDIEFNRESYSFLIITGPNMGGKSTYIRQAGMVVLMAQIGCFTPCSEAHVTLVDAILARVGAGDCQVRGVSTFMAEMLETSSILRSATQNSLVIIDELGRGTSTYDGFGLAWAISHHIATKIGSYCMFATHFHELTALADEVSSVANLHVTALTGEVQNDAPTLTMLYQVKRGVCDQSFGIHVAECVDFPKHVIESAKRKAAELEDYNVILPHDDMMENDPDTARKKRKIKQEGEEIIIKFLQAAKEVDWKSMSSSEIGVKLEELKKSMIPSDNQYISTILKNVSDVS
ncbi:DNA mismatch repair protein Msh2-like isoform X2 [Styela clava]